MKEYTRYKHIIWGFKSKKYVEWFKSKYPNLDAHHILDKKIDYLLYPVAHDYHIGVVHRRKTYYFDIWLIKSVDIFLEYANTLGKYTLQNYRPETLKLLFKVIQERERNGK